MESEYGSTHDLPLHRYLERYEWKYSIMMHFLGLEFSLHHAVAALVAGGGTSVSLCDIATSQNFIQLFPTHGRLPATKSHSIISERRYVILLESPIETLSRGIELASRRRCTALWRADEGEGAADRIKRYIMGWSGQICGIGFI
jgi:hypothetical protein